MAQHYWKADFIEVEGVPRTKGIYSPRFRRKLGRDQESVFILDVETVEIPERRIASITRLYEADFFLRTNAHSMYRSFGEGRCVFLGRITDRKGSVPSGLFPIGSHHRISDVVKGTPKIMNSIAKTQGDTVGDFIQRLDKNDGVPDLGYSMRLESERIGLRLRVAKPADLKFQINDVFLAHSSLSRASISVVIPQIIADSIALESDMSSDPSRR